MKICTACGVKFDIPGWRCPSCHNTPEYIEGYPALSPEVAIAGNGFKPEYFEQLAPLEDFNFWFRSRNRMIVGIIKRDFSQARNFLEIGCGTGFVLSAIEKEMPNLSLFGSEIHSTGLAYAGRRLKNAELFQMDARQIPFDNEFDGIGVFDVLEHIREDEQVLCQINRAVKLGGGLIVTVPQHPFLWSRQDEYACHVRRYRARELKDKIQRTGFEVIEMTSFVSLLLPFMIMARLKKGNPTLEYDPLSELKINFVLNASFEKILDLERWMIFSGFSFPFGGSLLVIAQKIADGIP